jgi:hypothetical protein
MNAEAITFYLERKPVCAELMTAVRFETGRRGGCGLARYIHTLRPHVIPLCDVNEWIKRDHEHRGEFLGVCNATTTIEDLQAMVFGG